MGPLARRSCWQSKTLVSLHTWNTLFGRPVSTGRKKEHNLSLCNDESVSVFLVSGSPEERKKYVR